MKIIVGLGNPGLQYENVRHNAGFWVVTQIAIKHSAHFSNKKSLFCEIARLTTGGEEVLLIKPMTFMNLSGKAVQSVLHWYKVSSAQMLIVHDDVSIPLGRLRLQQGGGAGGQHGIESIIEYLGGSKNFDRLKFGVGPDPGGERRADYVLSSVPLSDRELMHKCIETSCDAVEMWLAKGIQESMNLFNGLELSG